MGVDWNVVGLDDEGTRCEAVPWGKVDKSKLPKSSFAYTPTDNRSDWKLPYKTADGKIHCGGVKAARGAISGARSGKKMSIPASARAKINRAAKSCGFDQDAKEDTMDILTETHFTNVALSEEDKNDRGYHTARLLITRGDYVNKNERVYPMHLWEREVPKAQDKITTGSFVGMADHPGFFQGPSVLDTVIKFESLSIEGKEVWGEVMFIPTSKGRDVIEIAKAGVRIGVSTRGTGTGTRKEWTAPDGTIHKEVQVINDDYEWKAADLVVEGSVEGAAVYRFEHLAQDDIDQLQELLFSQIEEKVSAPLNAQITEMEAHASELEDLLHSQDVAFNELQVEHDKKGDLVLDLNDQLGASEKEANELAAERDELVTERDALQAELQESLRDLSESTDMYTALEWLLDKVKGEQFAMLLIETLKDCVSPDEVDKKWEDAKTTVEALALNVPGPSGKTLIEDVDPVDSDEDNTDSEKHRLIEELSGFAAPNRRR